MAKPLKQNGKWGYNAEASTTPQGYFNRDGDFTATAPDRVTQGGFTEYDAETQASLELSAGRYGVPDAPSGPVTPESWVASSVSNAVSSAAAIKYAANESNRQWDTQAASNEVLRGSALSMSSTYAHGNAMMRAREAESTAGLSKLADAPRVSLKKKGGRTATSAKFRI